jgi:hypothetical protein
LIVFECRYAKQKIKFDLSKKFMKKSKGEFKECLKNLDSTTKKSPNRLSAGAFDLNQKKMVTHCLKNSKIKKYHCKAKKAIL